MKAAPSKSRPGPSITPQQALIDYLALGGERSLRRLVQHYNEIRMKNPPSFATVALWSSRFGWERKAREHDEFVGAALLSRLRDEAVRCEFDRVASLLKVASVASTSPLRSRSTGASVADIKALTTTAIDAINLAEVLSSGSPRGRLRPPRVKGRDMVREAVDGGHRKIGSPRAARRYYFAGLVEGDGVRAVIANGPCDRTPVHPHFFSLR
jgi:hypothetical protein